MLKDLITITKFVKKFVNKKSVFEFIIIAIVTAVRVGLALLPSYYTMQILDQAIPDKSIRNILFFSFLVLLFTIFDATSELFLNYLYAKTSRNLFLFYQKKCVNKLFSLSGDFYSKMNTGEILTVINQDIGQIRDIFSSVIFNFISEAITGTFMIVYLSFLQFDLSLYLIAVLPFIFISQRFFQRKARKKYSDIREDSSEIVSELESMVSNIRQNILIKGQRFFVNKLNKVVERNSQREINLTIWNGFNSGSINLLVNIIIVLILSVGGYKITIDKMTLGILMIFYMNIKRIVGPILNISGIIMQIQIMLISMNKIIDFLNKKQEILLLPEAVSQDRKIENCEIKFYKVDFLYDDNNIIDQMNMKINQGTFNALIGESGCGKSTIVSLLYRFWDIKSGVIKIGMNNIQDYNLEYLRKSVVIMSQEVYLFNDTIYNNIVLEKTYISLHQVMQICKATLIDDFIESLPDKYDTLVGEKGVRLSGGERQRISIARSLVSREAPIYIFDEATSALDQITERKIMNNLKTLLNGKTVIFITHRIAAIADVNKIFFMKNGNITEQGTHEELLEKKCDYYNLFDKIN